MRRRGSSLSTCLLFTCGVFSCLPALKRADEQEAAAPDAGVCEVLPAPERAAPLVGASSVQLDSLSRALPNWSEECSACVRSACVDSLARCAADRRCSDFVSCRWGRSGDVSPGGEQRCGARLGESPEVDGSATRELSNCWSFSCTEECQLGREWSCLDGYELPTPDARGAVRIEQTLQTGFSNGIIPGVLVRYCPPLVDVSTCERQFDALGCTDTLGVSRTTVPISTDDRPGWRGYRHAFQPGNIDALLQSNLPVLLDRFMLQHVPSLAEFDVLAAVFGSDPSLGGVVFQVFDCAHTGADGVDIEIVPEAGQPALLGRVGYLAQADATELVSGPTRAAGNGGGAIADVPVDGLVTIRATLRETGRVIAEPRVWVTPGRGTLLEIHPEPGP